METAKDFESYVKKTPGNGCWLWVGGKGANGYGAFRSQAAHRVSYERFVGTIPSGGMVLHRCDVPHCVNPSHLYVGNQKDNMRDRKDRGRGNGWSANVGERNHTSKLVASQIPWIRTDARSMSVIAAQYGVSVHTVWAIKHRKSWRHL